MTLETSAVPAIEIRTPSRLLPLLLLLFVGSGCAALIYEIVWLQLLQLIIGSTAISLGVLLGTFMGGMCLGSILFPRIIPQGWHPLRVYAFLELGIGGMGLLILYYNVPVADFYTQYGGEGLTGIAFRGLVSGMCLLLPTMCMGATLPAIARWVESTPEGVSWMGFFYGGNIVGAVAGSLLAGFYLLRVYDMQIATYVAVGLNIVVAVTAIAFSFYAAYRRPRRSSADYPIPRVPGAWAVYVAIALSGLTGLGAEVVWTRMLSLMLGATVYTFSIILAVFLAGLGIGSSAGAMWARSLKRPAIALGVLQLLLAGAIGWTAYAIADSLPLWPIDPTLVPDPWFMFQIDVMRVVWAILPSALFWGASFPVALAAVAARGKDPGKLVGGVYAANTVGAIFGSLLFSMVFIPADGIGTQGSEKLLICIAAASAFIAFFPSLLAGFAPAPDEEYPASLWAVIPGAIAILVGLFGAGYLAVNVHKMPDSSVAYGRLIWTPEYYDKATDQDVFFRDDGREYKYVGEGMNVSVAVTEKDGIRYFHGAGKVQASSDPQDMRLQRMLGHLSALIATQRHNVLVVACGAGVTAGSFVPYPTDDVQHITIVDIEKKVPENVAQKWFSEQNYGVVRDPRTTVVWDDGRHFVRTTKQKFDIITSDPIDPWVKGCAALNTVEYYQMCLNHLNPGGVMSLWIPLYENNETSVKSIISTFIKVFPDGIVFSNDEKGEGYDAVLLGQCGEESGKPGPTHIDLDKLQNLLDSADYARVKQSLADVYFGQIGNGADVAADLMSTFAVQGSDLGDWVEAKNINYDKNLRLQFLSGLYLNTHDEVGIFDRMLNYYRFPSNIFTGSDARIKELQQALDTLGRSRFAKSPFDTIPLPTKPVEALPMVPTSRPNPQP